MDTSEAIFAFLSRFYANLSQFEDYCRLFEEFRERLWRERENLAIFALILGQKLPVWPPAGSQSTVLLGGGGLAPPRIFSGGGGPSELAPQPTPNLGGGHETLLTFIEPWHSFITHCMNLYIVAAVSAVVWRALKIATLFSVSGRAIG